ncbi:MAG: hypothetical protein WA964_12120 [Ilumatobacter sp.]|uniref:hypothetical protein n=1 Tax=Ilumatobacter sp. TaxID=1967498 RepID=UPI003C720A73
MSKTTALNIILGVLVAGLLATLLYQETTESEAVATTTTTTTTTVPETTTTTTTTTTTLPPTTTTTTTTTTFPVPSTSVAPTERFFTGVLVVNGTSAGERIPPVVERLNNSGYIDVRGVAGAVAAQETVIYYIEPFLGEAQVVAQDLGYDLSKISILSSTEAPPVAGIGVAKVIVYLGPGELPEAPPLPEAEEGAVTELEESAEEPVEG